MSTPPENEVRDAALAKMPPIWREVLEAQFSGKTIPEIAEQLRLTEAAVNNVLRVAEVRLRVLMNRKAVRQDSNDEADTIEGRLAAPISGNSKAGVGKWFSGLFERRPKTTWQQAWMNWNLNSHPDTLLHADAKLGHKIYSEICLELISKGGKKAVLLTHGWNCQTCDIHEFKMTGEPTSRLYKVKFYTHPGSNWKASGKRHIAQVMRCDPGFYFKSTSPTQEYSQISAKLLRIIEFDTRKNARLDYARFEELAISCPQRVNYPQPDA